MRNITGKYIKELEECLDEAQNISLVCHTNPDGDAIGSMLGFYHYLTKKGKRCEMISPSSLQDFLRWMDGADRISVYEDDPDTVEDLITNSDLVIMLDFNHTSRLGKMSYLSDIIEGKGVLVDHHPGPTIETNLTISEPGLSSTSELVYDLISHIEGKDFLYPPFVESIYVGMMTDTGNFSFGSYDGETLRILSTMLDNGLKKDRITDMVYDNFSADRMRLKGFALSERMVVLPEYRTAYISLSKSDLKKFNHRVGDTEGFVNMPLSIKNICLAVLFIEKGDHVKLSLRSKGTFSVNSLAEEFFMGGGHTNASGGRSNLALPEAITYFESILPSIKDQLINND